jgi:hypothetical protein
VKTLAGLLVAIGFFYAAYSGFVVLRSYLEISSVVDGALIAHARDGPAAIKTAILDGAGRAGIGLDARQVGVAAQGPRIHVHVRWSHPVLSAGGDPVLAIPLSVQRVVAAP